MSSGRGLEISGPGAGLLDEPLAFSARGAGDAGVVWRARMRDDDGRVWKASADRAAELSLAWVPVKEGTGPVAALASLRPVSIDVRAEASDGRSASRTVARSLVGEGVKVRRWKDGGVAATLHVPGAPACATVLIDGVDAASALAAPLLASRGVLVLCVASGTDAAAERLAAVPAAAGREVLRLSPAEVGLPPGVGARDSMAAAAARADAWDALLARLGARPRQ